METIIQSNRLEKIIRQTIRIEQEKIERERIVKRIEENRIKLKNNMDYMINNEICEKTLDENWRFLSKSCGYNSNDENLRFFQILYQSYKKGICGEVELKNYISQFKNQYM